MLCNVCSLLLIALLGRGDVQGKLCGEKQAGWMNNLLQTRLLIWKNIFKLVQQAFMNIIFSLVLLWWWWACISRGCILIWPNHPVMLRHTTDIVSSLGVFYLSPKGTMCLGDKSSWLYFQLVHMQVIQRI